MPEANQKAMKLLLVEDSDQDRKLLRYMLRRLGFVMISDARDAVAAIELLGEYSFDLILTDWDMPQMNGIDFVKEVRKRKHRMPIVMVTAHAEREKVLAAVEAGVTDFIRKPLVADVLEAKVKRVCSG